MFVNLDKNEFKDGTNDVTLSSINDILKWSNVKYNTKIAVSNGKDSYSYCDLFNYANEIADKLKELGVKRNDVITVKSTSNPVIISFIIAILKCDATYLPLSSQTPKERLEKIYRECGVKYEINVEKLSNNYFIDKVNEYDGININNKERIVYIIYTSGSTGSPKGVMIRELSLLNLICGLKEVIFDWYKDDENIALLSPFYFDASIKNIFLSLICGKTLYIVDELIKRNARKLLKFYSDNKITITDGTPSHINVLIDASRKLHVDLKIKHFLIGGESLNKKLLLKIFSLPWAQESKVTNLYGPTECCVDSTYYTIVKSMVETINNVPIGLPMPNCNVYVLNDECKKSKNLEKGIIYISGLGVAAGYINDSNSSKFLKCPFDNSIMYNTGDIGYFDDKGLLNYCGRNDSQQKINGYRIDLNEIKLAVESVISSECRVEVALIERANNKKIIICFIESFIPIDDNVLYTKLKERIYEYMIPTKYIYLDYFPVNKNGKIDINKMIANFKESG